MTSRPIACRVVGAQDRAAVFRHPTCLVFVIADGAGGTANGALAADAVIRAIEAAPPKLSAEYWAQLLARIDGEIQHGETTCVVAAVRGDLIVGASVGDSEAWLIQDLPIDFEPLTGHQCRKPLIGSGRAVPMHFSARISGRTLLIASDGLFKYTKSTAICASSLVEDVELAADRLLDAARLPSGAFSDDVSLILIR